MIGLGLLNPLTLLSAIQLSPFAHLFQSDPSEHFLVQGSSRYQIIHIIVAILSLDHHQHYKNEPLRRNLDDWQIDMSESAGNLFQLTGSGTCIFLGTPAEQRSLLAHSARTAKSADARP